MTTLDFEADAVFVPLVTEDTHEEDADVGAATGFGNESPTQDGGYNGDQTDEQGCLCFALTVSSDPLRSAATDAPVEDFVGMRPAPMGRLEAKQKLRMLADLELTSGVDQLVSARGLPIPDEAHSSAVAVDVFRGGA